MRECSIAFLTLGFVCLCTAASKASTGFCHCRNVCPLIAKCNFTEEANDFRCFIKKRPSQFYNCEWKPESGNSTSYKLCIKQRTCKCVSLNQKNSISASDKFHVMQNISTMTAYVIAMSEDQSCTYKRFGDIPSQMTLCGPPSKVHFERTIGHMSVQVDWGNYNSYIKRFSVKYREFNSTEWKKQFCINDRQCAIWNLTSSLTYEMQVQCVPNADCSQCSPGQVIIVPRELTDAPSIQYVIQDHVQDPVVSPGQRKVILKWKYAHSEAVTYYNVTVRKMSGERRDSFITRDHSLTVLLSYSAYNISVRGHNSAGSSPADNLTIESIDGWRDWFGPFNVSITSNNSFRLWWSSSISSECYSVEWWTKGQIPAFQPFYEKTEKTRRAIIESTFQPYTRYYFSLHTRLDKDTCNMKNVNGSEMTYGTSKAYLAEGSPISAPGNVSIINITHHSSVITWSPVSEEDLRGFLLGYNIYYTEDNTEAFIVVDLNLNSYELVKLKSNNAYTVQLSAFTAAGEGERSDPKPFVTNPQEFTALNSIIAAVIVGIIIFLLAFHLSCRLLHRAKKLIWPSIPNPGNSNAVQKIEIGHELQDILEPLNRQKLEESEGCDSSAVSVVESKKEGSPFSNSPTSEAVVNPTILLLKEDEDSTSTLEETIVTPTSSPSDDSVPAEIFPMALTEIASALSSSVDNENKNLSKSQTTAPVKPAVVFVSDYTTMEFFQQVAMSGIQCPSIQTGKPGLVSIHPGQDYVHQSCFAGNRQSSVSSSASNC